MDLLLKKGRGIGELKDMGTEHSLNVNVIKLIKELNALDKKMSDARSSKNYKATLNGIQNQLSLINQIEYYALVRMIRLEYDYKDVNTKLNDFEKHYDNETKKLKSEIKKFHKALKTTEKEINIDQVKQQIIKAENDLKIFYQDIYHMRSSIKQLKKNIKESCKKKIIKIKKVYHFA